MSMMLLVWLVCGVLTAGLNIADMGYDNESKRDTYGDAFTDTVNRRDWTFSMMWSLIGGPIALLFTLMFTGFAMHGWSLRLGGGYKKIATRKQ